MTTSAERLLASGPCLATRRERLLPTCGTACNSSSSRPGAPIYLRNLSRCVCPDTGRLASFGRWRARLPDAYSTEVGVRRRLRVGGPCATSTGFARFSTSPSRSARSTNKQWQRKYEIGRARGPWDRPTRQGRVDNFSRRVLPPDTREFFT